MNSWTKPTSGSWEEQAYWSLGVLPDVTQNVVFTTAGWKALAIGPETSRNYPQSMQVQWLQIASPVDSRNVLLMNFSGFEVPLQAVLLEVGTNSAFIAQSSWLQAGNTSVVGEFDQGDYAHVDINGQLHVGSDVRGFNAPVSAYYLTNGLLNVGSFSVGGFGVAGNLVQYGGIHTDSTFSVGVNGEYELYDGELAVSNGITVGAVFDYANTSTMNQYGGSVTGDTSVNGNYSLAGGTITGRMWAPSPPFMGGQHRVNAFITQTGGTNAAVSLDLGHPNIYGGAAYYVLSNGVVQVDSTETFGGGRFSQYNGTHAIASGLLMQGVDVGVGIINAEYQLSGGALCSGGIQLGQGSWFQQSGGSNVVTGDVVLLAVPPPAYGYNRLTDQYTLKGGLLSAGNLVVNAAFYGGFRQAGGSNLIGGKLTVQGVMPGAFYYTLEGGTLAVKDIEVSGGAFFQHTAGTITHSGLLTLNQGTWNAAASEQSLGPLRLLGGSSTNSAVVFPAGTSVLRLASSSAQPWDSTAVLCITNWHGVVTGGGETQVYFGSDASGLTPQQLAQIQFSLSGEVSSAQMLSTGEVVPAQVLAAAQSGKMLTLTWAPGWSLQSSTNVAGPYEDVSGAVSPYTTAMDYPSLFFRLRP